MAVAIICCRRKKVNVPVSLLQLQHMSKQKQVLKRTLLSIPDSLNRVLNQYIGELKAQNYAVWDPINKIGRKISKSSWIVRLVEKELRRQGKIS